MKTYWISGTNYLKVHGRWTFAKFTDVYTMQDDFAKKIKGEFDKMIKEAIMAANAGAKS